MRAIELFAGAGGLGMGVARAGFVPERIVEWDRWCCDTLRANQAISPHPWPDPTQGDIRAIDFSALEGRIALVSGGPPCQPFSLGGRHAGREDRRDMWPEAVRVVRETRPDAFIFENVKGLTRAGFASYLAYIVRQLARPYLPRADDESWTDHLARLERAHTGADQEPGYRVVWRVLDAADYGVPQRRARVVFVGFRRDLGVEWSFPEPTHAHDALLWSQVRRPHYWERHRVAARDRSLDARAHARGASLLIEPTLKPWRTLRDALAGLPDPERDPDRAAAVADHRFQPGARVYRGHTGSRLDEPAKALKAGVHGVPGGENMVVRADGTVRYLTVRESARVQTFPDAYRFRGAWSEAMRQLGNAVPVDLAEVIARSVARRLREAGADDRGSVQSAGQAQSRAQH